jgi:hypothetical protein
MSPEPGFSIPGAQERARLNTALLAGTAESGFWDDNGVPAPWPDDIEDWTPDIHPSDPGRLQDF